MVKLGDRPCLSHYDLIALYLHCFINFSSASTHLSQRLRIHHNRRTALLLRASDRPVPMIPVQCQTFHHFSDFFGYYNLFHLIIFLITRIIRCQLVEALKKPGSIS
jgi:hypothetical protein